MNTFPQTLIIADGRTKSLNDQLFQCGQYRMRQRSHDFLNGSVRMIWQVVDNVDLRLPRLPSKLFGILTVICHCYLSLLSICHYYLSLLFVTVICQRNFWLWQLSEEMSAKRNYVSQSRRIVVLIICKRLSFSCNQFRFLQVNDQAISDNFQSVDIKRWAVSQFKTLIAQLEDEVVVSYRGRGWPEPGPSSFFGPRRLHLPMLAICK